VRDIAWFLIGGGLSVERSGSVEGASDGQRTFLGHVCVDHRRSDVAVSEEILDGADIVALLDQAGGKGMPEGVAAAPFGDSRAEDGGFHGALQDAFVNVVSALPSRAGFDASF
jgi:hypothetical protein